MPDRYETLLGVPDSFDPDFGDADPEDAYTAGDDEISWDGVEELQARYDEIKAIEDPDERLEAAKALVAELNG